MRHASSATANATVTPAERADGAISDELNSKKVSENGTAFVPLQETSTGASSTVISHGRSDGQARGSDDDGAPGALERSIRNVGPPHDDEPRRPGAGEAFGQGSGEGATGTGSAQGGPVFGEEAHNYGIMLEAMVQGAVAVSAF